MKMSLKERFQYNWNEVMKFVFTDLQTWSADGCMTAGPMMTMSSPFTLTYPKTSHSSTETWSERWFNTSKAKMFFVLVWLDAAVIIRESHSSFICAAGRTRSMLRMSRLLQTSSMKQNNPSVSNLGHINGHVRSRKQV